MQIWLDLINIGAIIVLCACIAGFFFSMFIKARVTAFELMKKSIIGIGIGILMLATVSSFSNGRDLNSDELVNKLKPVMNIMLRLLALFIAVFLIHDLVLYYVKKKKVVQHTYVFQDLANYILRHKV